MRSCGSRVCFPQPVLEPASPAPHASVWTAGQWGASRLHAAPRSGCFGGLGAPQGAFSAWPRSTLCVLCPLQELCLIRFHPATEEEEVAYISLYSYFSSRGRFGVVANNSRRVKDLYLIPLGAEDPVPSKLLPFEGPGKRRLSGWWLGSREPTRALPPTPSPAERVAGWSCRLPHDSARAGSRSVHEATVSSFWGAAGWR